MNIDFSIKPESSEQSVPSNIFLLQTNTIYSSGQYINFNNILNSKSFILENNRYIYCGTSYFFELNFNIKYNIIGEYPYEIIRIKIYKNNEIILDTKYGYGGNLVISDSIVVFISNGDNLSMTINDNKNDIIILNGSFIKFKKFE